MIRQWDIYLFPFPEAGPHPAVIISPDERCGNGQYTTVNALVCTSLRAGAAPKPTHVMLNSADGFDWKTCARCDVIHLIDKSQLGRRVGSVSIPRRRAIAKKINECLRLTSL
ncbi:MAG: type II toxin-antitoxin system PemK/MazF family toxin [Roseimicrobium sp.]